MVNNETVNERGSKGKITAIFQTQPLPFNNGNYSYCHYYHLNKYRSVGNAHACNTQHNSKTNVTPSIALSIICHYAEHHYAECRNSECLVFYY
jgi:hypothetical protein